MTNDPKDKQRGHGGMSDKRGEGGRQQGGQSADKDQQDQEQRGGQGQQRGSHANDDKTGKKAK